MSEYIPDLTIETLGEARIPSPLNLSTLPGDRVANYVDDGDRVLFDPVFRSPGPSRSPDGAPLSFEMAGPRHRLFFDASKLRVGIVTCGGLCPGTNNVIRALVMQLHYRYGVRRIHGFKYGFQGLIPAHGHEMVDLTPASVADIHTKGGTILGSSRGHQDPAAMVDALERIGIGVFFCLGGDGTLRGALAIHKEVKRRGLKLAVIGIPKTIDNDIFMVERTFGFETAFSIAGQALAAAHTEAVGAPNGVGLVRLMGRHSGYIAAKAALALNDVNLVLVPEVPFDLHGKKGLFNWLGGRLERRKHAVIVVAEGAGQDLIPADEVTKDASGNIRLKDIGVFLKKRLQEEFARRGVAITLKYIDPSYIIRSAPANPNDSIFCTELACNAVHAAMAGKTGMAVGLWHGLFTHVPIREAVRGRKVIDPESSLWLSVLEATGQPPVLHD